MTRIRRRYVLGVAGALALAASRLPIRRRADSQAAPLRGQKAAPAAAPGDQPASGSKDFFIHAFHNETTRRVGVQPVPHAHARKARWS